MRAHRAKLYSFLIQICLLHACGKPPDIEISAAGVRPLLPGRDTTAAYFTLTNHSARPVTLLGARAATARSIEMHRTRVIGQQVGMQRVPQVTIAPGEQVEFAPGGLHLMLFGVSEEADPVMITLLLDNDRQLPAAFSKLSL